VTRHANGGLDRQGSRKPIPPDYDRDPGRFRFARTVLHRHALAPDIHERVAGRLPWESVDRRLADAAPAVPLFNRRG
jgi:hypothetical protein